MMRVWKIGAWVLGSVLMNTGCGGNKSDSGPGSGDGGAEEVDEDGDESDDEAVDCGSNAPEITEVVLSNGGLEDIDGTPLPVVLAEVRMSDSDGDLTAITVEIFPDGTVDGAVDTGSSPFQPSDLSIEEPPCSVLEAGLDLGIPISEELGLEYGTLAEVGFIVYDAAGLASPVFVAEVCLPNQDGSDGSSCDG